MEMGVMGLGFGVEGAGTVDVRFGMETSANIGQSVEASANI